MHPPTLPTGSASPLDEGEDNVVNDATDSLELHLPLPLQQPFKDLTHEHLGGGRVRLRGRGKGMVSGMPPTLVTPICQCTPSGSYDRTRSALLSLGSPPPV